VTVSRATGLTQPDVHANCGAAPADFTAFTAPTGSMVAADFTASTDFADFMVFTVITPPRTSITYSDECIA
jgi:hypothetical protein